MPPTISNIVQALEPSATIGMATKAKELKATGLTVYDLSLGEPDFTTPQHICDAANAAMKPIKVKSISGNPRPSANETKMLSTLLPRTLGASAATSTGTLPNFTNPVAISIHVSAVEKNAARNNRKLKTTTSLNVMTTLSEL